MIRIAKEKDKEKILDILKESIVDNIYLYIDILMFGLEKEYLNVWINEQQNEINQVILKYYNSFQIYSKKNSYNKIVNLILKHKPSMVSGTENIIRSIYEILKDSYDVNYGAILEQERIKVLVRDHKPTLASINDMEEIAGLICIDKSIGGHYKKSELVEQLSARFQEKTGRNYIIKEDDKIIAHYSTYAESPDIAIMGGLIVHPLYRGRGLAKALHIYLSNILVDEGKRVFLFCNEKEVLKMYLSLGAKNCGRYGKLTPKNERRI